MVQGRRAEARAQVFAQAVLVWSVGEMSQECVLEYLRFGDIHTRQETPPPYSEAVEMKVAEIMANGGRFVM